MIDSNMAITITSLWLKLGKNGLPTNNLGNTPSNDKLARFRTRARADKFQGNKTTIFLNDEVASRGVGDSHTGFKGRRNPPKRQIGSKSYSEA
jgi:hypothetical protein